MAYKIENENHRNSMNRIPVRNHGKNHNVFFKEAKTICCVITRK